MAACDLLGGRTETQPGRPALRVVGAKVAPRHGTMRVRVPEGARPGDWLDVRLPISPTVCGRCGQAVSAERHRHQAQ
jgi:hypothetical protein